MPPGGDPAFLNFWFFFIKEKEHKAKQLQVCLNTILLLPYFFQSGLRPSSRSFSLMKKNQKIKKGRIASGRPFSLPAPG
ncbi:MAG: hypothetical protein ACRYFL_02705 [Janthinobacterium lividum]